MELRFEKIIFWGVCTIVKYVQCECTYFKMVQDLLFFLFYCVIYVYLTKNNDELFLKV